MDCIEIGEVLCLCGINYRDTRYGEILIVEDEVDGFSMQERKWIIPDFLELENLSGAKTMTSLFT